MQYDFTKWMADIWFLLWTSTDKYYWNYRKISAHCSSSLLHPCGHATELLLDMK